MRSYTLGTVHTQAAVFAFFENIPTAGKPVEEPVEAPVPGAAIAHVFWYPCGSEVHKMSVQSMLAKRPEIRKLSEQAQTHGADSSYIDPDGMPRKFSVQAGGEPRQVNGVAVRVFGCFADADNWLRSPQGVRFSENALFVGISCVAGENC